MRKRQDRTAENDSPAVVRKQTLRQIDRSLLAKVAGGNGGGPIKDTRTSKYCTGR